MYKRALLSLAPVVALVAFIFVSRTLSPEPQVRSATTTPEAHISPELSELSELSEVTEAASTPDVALANGTGFDAWLVQWNQATSPSARDRLKERGAQLATQRAAIMKRLIRENPDAALELALSYAEYAALPEAIQSIVEEPFSNSGSIDVTTLCSEHATHYRLEYTQTVTHTRSSCRVSIASLVVKRVYRFKVFG